MPVQPLVHPIYSAKLRRAWRNERDECMVCGIREASTWRQRFPGGLQVHHLVKRPRSDEWCNLLLVCGLCHLRLEGESVVWKNRKFAPMKEGVALWCKRERDPENWDPERIKTLWGRATLPELEPPPR